jgi:predicted dehydrogenase
MINSRRQFIQVAGAAAAITSTGFAGAAPIRAGKLLDPNKKMRIACVGVGNKGFHDLNSVAHEDLVAMCDVDDWTSGEARKKYPDVPFYKDYRKMLDELDDQIDGVVVATPDHMHFPIAMAAIERGKHIFVQKPIAMTVWEARRMTEAARKHNVVSGMGNQGHAGEGIRLTREWTQAGLIGDVTEVHCWTQKLTDGGYRSALRDVRPEPQEDPKHLDWNLWLGTAQWLDYSREYAPKKWRGWWDIGNGALGDIGCHTMDAPFWALDLGSPIAVTAETSGYNPITYPDWSIITYEFAARGDMPPVKLIWYDGGKVPERPAELDESVQFEKRNGYYMVGSEGTIYDPTEKAKSPRIYPTARMAEVKDQLKKRPIPRVPESDCHKEWIAACKGGPKAGSNFDYSGPLSEMVLLGNLAIRAEGQRVEWNSKKMTTNIASINPYINPPKRAF